MNDAAVRIDWDSFAFLVEMERRQGCGGVSDYKIGEILAEKAEDTHDDLWQVIRLDAIPHVPDDRNPRDPRGYAPDNIRLQRVGMDQVYFHLPGKANDPPDLQ